jgi:hypothetical protein
MPKSTIYRGNTINNFGRNFPVPYIERIELRDVIGEELEEIEDMIGFDPGLSPISKVTIMMSILINTDDDFELEEFIDELFNDLNLNIVVLTDKERIESLKASKRNIKSILTSMFTSGEEGSETPSLDTPSIEGLYSQINTEPLSSFAADIVFTGEYDENTNKILKSSNLTFDMYVPGIATQITDLTIFAGTSIGQPAELLEFQDIAMALSFGDLAYEVIKVDNSLSNRDKIGYFSKDEAYYPGMPIIALNGNYYQSENYDQENIKKDVERIMDEYKQDLSSDPELQSVFDSIEVIYAEYGETPKYLTQLNQFRSNIMNQDQATRSGRFYERYRRVLINSNAKILEGGIEVFKKITYASKIRDFRPSQDSAELIPGYNDELEDNDLLYELILQTNIAKYVSARSGPGDDSLFQPEAPYDPSEMKDAYVAAIAEIGKRFDYNFGDSLGRSGGHVTGVNNVETWMTTKMQDSRTDAVATFKCSIGKFISWATTTTYDCTTSNFGTHRYRRVYRGGYGTAAVRDDNSYNLEAFYAAQRLFGHHGDSGCTLEFGIDAPRSGNGWDCRFHSQTLGSSEFSIPQTTVYTDDPSGRFKQYKCFNQILPIQNLIGHGSTTNETEPETEDDEVITAGRYGYFLKLWMAGAGTAASEWNLKWPNTISERIENLLNEAEELNEGGIDLIAQTAVAANALWHKFKPDGNKWMYMVQEVEQWDALVADWDLLDDEGAVKQRKLSQFAEAYADTIFDNMSTVLWLASALTPTYRLRWCPDMVSDTGWLDNNRDSDSNPYGGKWQDLATLQVKRNANSDSYSARDEADLDPFYWSGACGSTELYSAIPSGTAGIGRATYNPSDVLIARLNNAWHSKWRDLVVDAVKDIVPLLAEIHGLNIASGTHRRLSYMDIVVEKYGYFFFDMEKYIKQQSVISRYMDVGTFEKYFTSGRDMVNRTIRIDDVTFRRWNAVLSGDTWRAVANGTGGAFGTIDNSTNVEMTWNPNSGASQQPTDIVSMKFESTCFEGPASGKCAYATIKQMDTSGWQDIAISGTGDDAVLVDDETGETIKSYTQWSYLMQRNYDFAYSDKVPDDYRMACFAYNYYVDDDIALAAPDAIKITVGVSDQSDKIIKYLKKYIRNIRDEYNIYADLARENCAYNHFDSQFNQFFINQMDEKYAGQEASAPWLRMAATYTIFQDLLYGKYGGEFSIVLDAARAIADTINPKTGDLQRVEDYALKLDEMVLMIEGIYEDVLEDMFDGEDRLYSHVDYVIGNSGFASTGQNQIVINKGIIDYASDHTDEFPTLPDATLDR